MLKKILVTVLLVLGTSAAWSNESAEKSSKDYIESLLNLMDKTKETNVQLLILQERIDAASEKARFSERELNRTKRSINLKADRLRALPNLITNARSSIVSNRNEQNRILNIHFPDSNSVSEAVSSVRSRGSFLENERGRLLSSLRVIESDYDQEFKRLERQIDEKIELNNQNRRTRAQNERRFDPLERDVRKLKQEIDDLKTRRDDPRLVVRIREARDLFSAALKKRNDENRNCIKRNFFTGKYKDRSETCKNYRRAKNNLEELEAIKSGELIRSKRSQRRDKLAEIKNLRDEQERLKRQHDRRLVEIEDDRRRLLRIDDDKLIATRPIRSALAQVDFDLQQLQPKMNQANRLQGLESDNLNLRRTIVNGEAELEQLPNEIENLESSLPVLRENAAADAMAFERISTEEAELKRSIEQEASLVEERRNSLLDALQSSPALAEATEKPIEEQEILYPSRDWTVSTTLSDEVWTRASCKAQTTTLTTVGDFGVSAKLSVVNLQNNEGVYNEPIVMMTVSSSDPNLLLDQYLNASLRASSTNEEIEMNLLYSLSDASRLVFVSKLLDRKKLIDLIAAKNNMFASLISDEESGSENITFSLRGSHNSLKSRSQKSLNNACGGIQVTNY
jgi:chromosome segregation ATPase